MKIPLISWGDRPISTGEGGSLGRSEDYILQAGHVDLDELALELEHLTHQPIGLIPPLPTTPEGALQSIATAADQLRERLLVPVYVPILVTPNKLRDTVWMFQGAGHDCFVLRYDAPYLWFGQVADMMMGCKVHVAGGDPGRARWTWSEEELT